MNFRGMVVARTSIHQFTCRRRRRRHRAAKKAIRKLVNRGDRRGFVTLPNLDQIP